MDILPVCLTLTICFVHAGSSNNNGTNDKQIIEENVTDCVETNYPSNIAPEKAAGK
ncbi:uncharacterized protein LOC108906956 [Anoplophora glabripennis]|uniref:uncharacterized protein LOC108906956 n=1 Tax=Anoplophora glabripennis TaxID=217634 RepID=UPI000873CED7|nr:uncharacterized protein LOC108906956 [Anoplophora glabripennis]